MCLFQRLILPKQGAIIGNIVRKACPVTSSRRVTLAADTIYMDVAGTSQAQVASGASRISRRKPDRRVKREGKVVRDRDVPDIFEKLIEESSEVEGAKKVQGRENEEGRDDAERQMTLPQQGNSPNQHPHLDVEA